MQLLHKIKLIKNGRLSKLLAYNFKGVPVGIVIGVALMAGSITYAAPKMLNSRNISATSQSKSSPIIANQNSNAVSQSTAKDSDPTSLATTAQPSSTPQIGSSLKISSNNGTASAPSANTSPGTPVATKPAPTITGIAVITPDPGANQSIYIPYCDFGSISSGTPQTCNHYKPIEFTLVTLMSDGSSKPVSWSDATANSVNPSGGYPFIPTLVNIDKTNSALIEGTGMGYFLNDHTLNATIRIDVTYQGWTYAKYIHIYVSSLWG